MSDSEHGGLDGLEEAAEAADLERMWDREDRERLRAAMPGKYRQAKVAKVGSTVQCPVCDKPFRKRSYQQAFCSNKGKGNCKDTYWNTVSEKRAFRARLYNL